MFGFVNRKIGSNKAEVGSYNSNVLMKASAKNRITQSLLSEAQDCVCTQGSEGSVSAIDDDARSRADEKMVKEISHDSR